MFVKLETAATILMLLAVLLACKKKPKPAPPPIQRGVTPAQILTTVKMAPKIYEDHPVIVTGTVLEMRRGGDETPPFVDLDAGKGKRLPAGMKPYSCLRGVCFDEPPAVGTEATLKCVGAFLLGKPVLAQCEVAK